jgi:hypothetical protein
MVTATSDRRRDPQVGFGVAGWGERSAFGSSRGWPWWAAVLLALGLSIAGAIIDMKVSGNLAKVFDGAYFIGCVGAVCLVRRRNLFGPMVQAPLILAVTVPVTVLLTKGMPTGSGMTSKLIALGVPLVTGFPTMAITTGATVLIGGIRFLVQRRPAGADLDEGKSRGRGDARRPASRADRPDRPDLAGRSDRPGRSDRDGDLSDRPGRAGQERRPRPPGTGRPSQDRIPGDERAAPSERAAPRDRARTQPPSRGRGDAPDRGGRAGTGRSAVDRDRDRGQQPREQSRDSDRSQQPRTGRPTRDDGRRQPPRRRDDDDY